MEYQLIDDEEVTEPVTLAEVKAYSQIDADYSSDDDTLGILITTARVRLEQYLNIGLANRNVTLQWQGGLIELPLSPNGEIVSLKDKDDASVTSENYTVSAFQNKSIFVNDIAGDNYHYWYSALSMRAYLTPLPKEIDLTTIYTLVYNTGYETLPNTLKQAILAEVDFLFKLKGLPVTTLVSPNAKMLANGYSRNLIL